jgi:hypothetical protein
MGSGDEERDESPVRQALRADRGDVLFGCALVLAGCGYVAYDMRDVGEGAWLLGVIVGAYVAVGLVAALVRLSLRRGFAGVARWTFGFVGRFCC